jgi:hypothetical protein
VQRPLRHRDVLGRATIAAQHGVPRSASQGRLMSDPAHGPLPEVLARLTHDAAVAPTRLSTSPVTRITGGALCALIFAVVILMGTGQLL